MKKVLLKKDGLERAGLKAIMEEIGVRNEGGGGERGGRLDWINNKTLLNKYKNKKLYK